MAKPQILILALVLVAAVCLSSACGGEIPTAIDNTASASPLPTPAAATAPPTLLPRAHTPQPGLGIVEGLLTMNGQPSAGQTLYLAPIIATQNDFEVAALDAANGPRAESDASGYFVFLDVQPGRYALGIASPSGAVILQRNGQEIIADVQAGQISDLGTVDIPPFGQ